MKNLFRISAIHASVSIALFGACSTAFTQERLNDIKQQMHVELSRAAIQVIAPEGIKIDELSALAWDADEQLLYALSDKGNLFHFRLKLKGKKIAAIEAVYSVPLSTAEQAGSEPSGVDAEGLAVLNANNGKPGDTELIAVDERKQDFMHLSPKGVLLRKTSVPAPLNDPLNYQGTNKGLEAVSYHPTYGILTAPELPLKGAPDEVHTIYAQQRQWSFPKYSEDARLKAIEVLPNGNLMVLERTKSPVSKLLTSSLRYVDLRKCTPGQLCRVLKNVVLPEGSDNFEGLAHLGGQRFLIVNDHNGEAGQAGTLLFVKLRRSITQTRAEPSSLKD